MWLCSELIASDVVRAIAVADPAMINRRGGSLTPCEFAAVSLRVGYDDALTDLTAGHFFTQFA